MKERAHAGLFEEAQALILAIGLNDAGIGEPRCLLNLAIGCSAFVFYRIGELDYGKGWPLGTLSVVISVLARVFLPLPLITVPGCQVLLYIALLIFNLVRKTPPRL